MSFRFTVGRAGIRVWDAMFGPNRCGYPHRKGSAVVVFVMCTAPVVGQCDRGKRMWTARHATVL